ncbi:hypothetical protein C1752_03720 [Acaryochloris thomasi RCC1774]|uniref:Uncharacterized protein n=1 Tax=Acaryochloris thomasi RCC1774 TaxID=1764569 RepID=A0A2W1JLP1_9CYAN|nr:hypothetical protein [Acaryochloris thomasi]PZD72375.1 hypothetical protein C1752_03720 [Acaryochloris thomasi RCC1774]
MTEPNNTPNDPSDQESLDDVLRGLTAEGSEEEQSLDDILASLSEDEPDELSVPETLDTDDLLASTVNDSIEPTLVEPALPAPSPLEPEPSAPDATPIRMENISAESEQWVDEASAESILSDIGEPASPVVSQSPDEPALPIDPPGEVLESVVTDNADSIADSAISSQSEQPLSTDSQAIEATVGADALDPPLASALPEPEESISFEIADSSASSADAQPASPFDPLPSQSITDVESPFAAPVDDTLAAFTDSPESATASSAADSIPESIAEPEPQPDSSTLPSMEAAASFEAIGGGTEAPSPFEPPVTASPAASEPPFSAPKSDVVEPAFTSFTDTVAGDSPAEAQSLEQPLEEPPQEEVESAEASQPQATEQPWGQASESDLPAPTAFDSEPSPTPLDAAAEPEPAMPAAAFSQPEDPVEEPAAREPLELTDSDPDFSGPELPSLPPLAQPTFSEPAVSLSQASIDTPAAVSSQADAHPPVTLKTLLERPRHRWLVPFGFIMILVLFGAIIFGALRGNQESDPAPETQEQSFVPGYDER